jgi:uncharacterized protein (DUF302 family)
MATAAVVSKFSPWSVEDTVARLSAVAKARGLTVFAVVDHSTEAAAAGLGLRETTVVLLGSAAAWTPVIEAAPLAALDFPIGVVVWSDQDQTMLSHVTPAELGRRYGIADQLIGNGWGIDEVIDVVINR